MDSHELRDLLKSTLIDSGCRIDVADHVIGHKPKDSYEKQAKLYPETLRKEYSKASKRLNIFTKFTSVVNGTDDSDELKAELNDALVKLKQKELLEELKDASIQRHDDILKEQQRQAAEIQKQLEEIRKELSELKGDEKTEFCLCQLFHHSLRETMS